MAEELRPLPGPYEIFDIGDGESVRFVVTSWERGSMVIHPRYAGAPAEKTIPVLRVHVTTATKPYPPMYYDVTSKTLTWQWLPLLMAGDYRDYAYIITKHGVAPRARFTLERVPL